MAASKAFLRALRKKYGLGEFRKAKGSTPRSRLAGKTRKQRLTSCRRRCGKVYGERPPKISATRPRQKSKSPKLFPTRVSFQTAGFNPKVGSSMQGRFFDAGW